MSDYEYIDPNWCPDCGEPRGVCRCEEMRTAAYAIEEMDDDDDPGWRDDADITCPHCNGTGQNRYDLMPCEFCDGEGFEDAR